MFIRYYLGRFGWEGRSGEIPKIFLEQIPVQTGELPPISKTHEIQMSYLRDEAEQSELNLKWLTENDGIIISTICQANDLRLKKQFKENPELAEAFIKWVIELQSFIRPKERAVFKLDERLIKADIPEDIKPFVSQVKKWKGIIEALEENDRLVPHYGSKIDGEGCYLAVVHDFYSEQPEHGGNFGSYLMEALPLSVRYFSLNPTIGDDCIWWKIQNMKILLPHELASEKTVEYYGYQAICRAFLAAKKEKTQAEQKRSTAALKKIAEEQKEKEDALRKKLLS